MIPVRNERCRWHNAPVTSRRLGQGEFFGGLSAPEIARLLGISLATVERDWATARIWECIRY
jgi:hypothetical protein